VNEVFDYKLPAARVAHAPATPRDAARLMVFDRSTGRTADAVFRDLPSLLPKGALLVMNDTAVTPCRLELEKPTGGKVRLLFLGAKGRKAEALADRPLKERMGLRLPGTPHVVCRVMSKRGGIYSISLDISAKQLNKILDRHGSTPLPPYIKTTLSEKQVRQRYQSVFAKNKGSAAAPTASLHFTPRLLAALKKAGHKVVFVTLHVGLGTFAPVTEEQRRTGTLHVEHFFVSRHSATAINKAKLQGNPIIPVGTTALRTLESASDLRGNLRSGKGKTDLFIRPGYQFRVADGLITNFHVPGSSLLMLVSAFVGKNEIARLYRRAIRKKYRFFSFGDGMLLR